MSEKSKRLSVAITAFTAGLFVGFLAFNVWPRWRALKEEERQQAERMLELQRLGERLDAAEQAGEKAK